MELALLVYLGDFLDTLKSWVPGLVILTFVGTFIAVRNVDRNAGGL